MAYSLGSAPHPAQLRHDHQWEAGRAAAKELGLLPGSLLRALQMWPRRASVEVQMGRRTAKAPAGGRPAVSAGSEIRAHFSILATGCPRDLPLGAVG